LDHLLQRQVTGVNVILWALAVDYYQLSRANPIVDF
jgi:hypothetical protein